ncbi:MAG: DUF2786 domain-containing protein [Gammaproteobacteria bacterium]|jgi:hypothetical protein
MDKQKIISKIHKCLRLAESGNANEAASALRQAQGMMRKYGISETDVRTSQIQETSAGSGGYYNPPYWAVALAELVAEAFDCRLYLARREASHPQFRFIGLEQSASIAAYSFSVLYRQLRLARREYIRGLGLDDKQEARRRGNVFAQAWLYQIARVVAEFIGNPDKRAAVDAYVQTNYGDTAELLRDPTDPAVEDYEVILSGLRAAYEVRLLRPVHTANRSKLVEEACA